MEMAGKHGGSERTNEEQTKEKTNLPESKTVIEWLVSIYLPSSNVFYYFLIYIHVQFSNFLFWNFNRPCTCRLVSLWKFSQTFLRNFRRAIARISLTVNLFERHPQRLLFSCSAVKQSLKQWRTLKQPHCGQKCPWESRIDITLLNIGWLVIDAK